MGTDRGCSIEQRQLAQVFQAIAGYLQGKLCELGSLDDLDYNSHLRSVRIRIRSDDKSSTATEQGHLYGNDIRRCSWRGCSEGRPVAMNSYSAYYD
ncbi:MAG: hypothetical protein ACJ8R9_05575 [Steroidobacteraceae bacterium]